MHAWPCVAAEATLAVRTALHGAGRQAALSCSAPQWAEAMHSKGCSFSPARATTAQQQRSASKPVLSNHTACSHKENACSVPRTPANQPLPFCCPPHSRFFYADGDDCNTLFCRSGVRGSNSTNFPVLPVYKSMTGLLQVGVWCVGVIWPGCWCLCRGVGRLGQRRGCMYGKAHFGLQGACNLGPHPARLVGCS